VDGGRGRGFVAGFVLARHGVQVGLVTEPHLPRKEST
jgi:hypothetical protein